MELNIQSQVFDLDPSLIIAAIMCQGITVGSRHGILDQIWEERIPGIPESLGTENLGQHPAVAPWRRVYSLFGAKPSKYPSSLEALLKRLVKDGILPRINDLVDIYNWISVSHLIPAGGEDLGRIIGNIRLVRAQGGETFHPLYGETLELIPAGEVIYADDLDVICRRWNWRESDRTKLTEATHDAVIILEGLSPLDRGKVDAAAQELAYLVRVICGGICTVQLLDVQHPAMIF